VGRRGRIRFKPEADDDEVVMTTENNDKNVSTKPSGQNCTPALRADQPTGAEGGNLSGGSKLTGPQPPLNIPLNAAFIGRGQIALKELNDASPDAGPDERILHRLVADQVAVAAALTEAQAQLAARVGLLLDDPKRLAAVSRVLKDVVVVTNAIAKRVEGALGVAANLRAQRRFLAHHGGRESGDGF
jgi:hypothetical protein